MVGIWSEYSQHYLIVFSLSTAALFSIPIFLSPIHWARIMRWTIPENTDLVLYFGRCLGSLALVINLVVLLAVIRGDGIPTIFHGLNLLMALMVCVHIYGAAKHIQPITETLEIGFWSALLILNICFQPI